MKDLRRAFNMAWSQAESSGGDFQDHLLHFLSINLGMPILNEVSDSGPTDGGVIEMGGVVSNVFDPSEVR